MTLEEVKSRLRYTETPVLVEGGEIAGHTAACPACHTQDALFFYQMESGALALSCEKDCDPQDIYDAILAMPQILQSFTAADLMRSQLGEVFFLVENLLHVGLAILSADPKTGKSWMALDLCFSVAAGLPFMGFDTRQCDTLYLALEDGKRRLQSRMRTILQGMDIAPPDNFYLATAANPLDGGLAEQLAAHMRAHPATRLIVIDVLNRVRARKKGRSQNAYESDSAEFARLKAIADKHNICVLLIHHNRKGKDTSDPFQNLSGSMGILGGVDEGLMLVKENRMDRRATLSIISREMGDRELVVEFDPTACVWRYVGTAQQEQERALYMAYNADPVTIAVRGMMKQMPWGFTTKAGEFELNMARYANTTVARNQIGERFRRYALYFYRYDSIRVEVPSSTKDRTYKFSFADTIATTATADTSDSGDTVPAGINGPSRR